MDYGDRILNSARDLFFKFGIRSVTMDDLARKLGISKKTLYNAYKNKNDIVETITMKFLKNHAENYELLVIESNDAVKELLMLMESLNYIFERLNTKMIFDMQRYFPEAWQIFTEYKNSIMLNKIIANLKRGIKEGLYRRNINVEIIAQMRLEQVQIAMDPFIFPSENITIKEIHEQLLLQYLYGITTLKGHKLINKYLEINED